MGAKMVRGLLLAAAAGAPLASSAAASYYTYEKSWEYDVYAKERLFVISEPRVGGDGTGLAVPVGLFTEELDNWAEFRYLKFDADGNKIGNYEIFFIQPMGVFQIKLYDCVMDSGVPIVSYDTYYYSPLNEHYHSCLEKPDYWYYIEEGSYRIKDLAPLPSASYFYCYRIYAGDYRVCKMVGKDVISYFTPLSAVTDMEAGLEGAVYIASDDFIWRYVDTGSVVASWRTPSAVVDLTLDSQDRLLALASDNYTYVYGDGGTLLGSFTAPYATNIYSADMGPDDKYFVLGCIADWDVDYNIIRMYRFAPSPTNIQPTSLGKIKAIFN